MIQYSDCGVVWYAMKTIYKKELQAKKYLDALSIPNFVPMQQVVSKKGGRKTIVLKPAVHNLIFVKTDLAQLKEIKNNLKYLYNRLTTEDNLTTPIIVPTVQMDQFIDAITNHLQDIAYVDLTTEALEKGTPVRITDGKFKGYTGVLERVKGKRDRRVYVNIQGIAAYRFEVEASAIEKL
ncbi:MAG: UpxY family transcription antiterminator [Rikenellaceae bacterium]